MRKLILLNLYAFLFWIVTLSLSNFDSAIFNYLKSFSNLVLIMILSGINLTAILQLFYPQKLSNIEFISIASILALFITPFLITFEYASLGWLSPKLPLANSLIIFAIFLIVSYIGKNKLYLKNIDFPNFQFKKNSLWQFIKSPFFWALIIYTSAVAIAFSSFRALPELDPYYWYFYYQDVIDQGKITLFTGYRPLFISLIYALNQAAGIALISVFKYVLPLMTLLILIPAQLLAQTHKSWLKQFAILLLPFISASTFLYSQIPIPQAILNIITCYFTLFLLYSWITGKNLFFFAAGVIMVLAYYYHETIVLIALIWLSITLIFFGKKILETARKNILATLLAAFILLVNVWPYLAGPYDFLKCNVGRLAAPITSREINLLFPAQYVNVDGNAMGWGDLTGVTKYYIYYAGSVFFVVISYWIYLTFINFRTRKELKKDLFSKEILVLTLSFLCFFSISEILPRFFNIAFLPERAWIFGSLFSAVFMLLIFKYQKGGRLMPAIIVVAFFINLGGALYINNLKKYIFTDATVRSAEWIRNNLPKDRIIFVNNNLSAMRLYSESAIINAENEFYFNKDSYEKSIGNFLYGDYGWLNNYKKNTDTILKNITDLRSYDAEKQKKEIIAVLSKNSDISNENIKLLSLPNNKDKNNIYIYYSKINPNNPYLDRPYYNIPEEPLAGLIFDRESDKFERIYFDDANDITIWKIL
jgi:hypothetical protein